MLLAEAPPADRPVTIVPIGAEAEVVAFPLAQELRRAGIAVDLAFKGKPGQRMKRADRLGRAGRCPWAATSWPMASSACGTSTRGPRRRSRAVG